MILAARVFTGTEATTVTHLRDMGLPAWSPRERFTRKLFGKARPHSRPAWPGYVFIEADLDQVPKIRALDTVYAFVATTLPDGSRKPASIDPGALQAVFWEEMAGNLDHTPRPDWLPTAGQRVKVRGAAKGSIWAGHLGQVLRNVGKASVVQIGRYPATVDHADLEAA